MNQRKKKIVATCMIVYMGTLALPQTPAHAQGSEGAMHEADGEHGSSQTSLDSIINTTDQDPSNTGSENTGAGGENENAGEDSETGAGTETGNQQDNDQSTEVGEDPAEEGDKITEEPKLEEKDPTGDMPLNGQKNESDNLIIGETPIFAARTMMSLNLPEINYAEDLVMKQRLRRRFIGITAGKRSKPLCLRISNGKQTTTDLSPAVQPR